MRAGNSLSSYRQFSTHQISEIEERRKQRYEDAQLPQPYQMNNMQEPDEVEEMDIEDLIALDRGNFIQVVDGTLDEYLLDDSVIEDPYEISHCQIGKDKKGDASPTKAEILFSAHLVDRNNVKRPRTHHKIINDEDIEPLQNPALNPDEFTPYNNKAKPRRRRQVEPLIDARVKDGPLDYMNILDKAKVEISLKDLAQTSPAARKHWKHVISRINDKRAGRKRRQSEIAEVAWKSSEDKIQNMKNDSIPDVRSPSTVRGPQKILVIPTQ
ncbi:hypothetical protein K3495_g5775 [Podosphaera aphanis]|nr:hypothetical protein K3495_g5775 [Podosphaera aphanis]